jgi:hypothetical protein
MAFSPQGKKPSAAQPLQTLFESRFKAIDSPFSVHPLNAVLLSRRTPDLAKLHNLPYDPQPTCDLLSYFLAT